MQHFLIEKLFSLYGRGGIKLGLETMRRLSAAFDEPHRAFRTVHIAGTNGKGSVATKTAAALQAAGFRTGLFTSPHIETFRERIRIDGEMIGEEEVLELLAPLMECGIEATFFEITTLLALLYFKKQKVDYAVIETGMGGRLDATNIIVPEAAAITSIGRDHCRFLGESLEEIAREKGGIIKPNVPCVVGPTVNLELPVIKVEGEFADYEEENCAVAERLLKLIGVGEKAVAVGLQASAPCRFESVPGEVPTVLDVAHNPDGLQALFKRLARSFPEAKWQTVAGLSSDKELSRCLDLLEEKSEALHLVASDNSRSFRKEGCMPVAEGVRKARGRALQAGQNLLVCGSFYIMADAQKALR